MLFPIQDSTTVFCLLILIQKEKPFELNAFYTLRNIAQELSVHISELKQFSLVSSQLGLSQIHFKTFEQVLTLIEKQFTGYLASTLENKTGKIYFNQGRMTHA